MMDIKQILRQAAGAAPRVASLEEEQISAILRSVSDEVERQIPFILEENQRDLERMDPADPKYDRLKLTAERIGGMVADLRKVIELPSPVGEILWETMRPNGIYIRRVAVPFGVVGVIYEARPNVTLDVFSLCFRTRNVCVLKGGSDAQYSNQAIVDCIYKGIEAACPELDKAVCTLLPADREATLQMLNAVGLVDVIIPRGSSALIHYVRDNARVPVIETGAGVCHTYVDCEADVDKARAIVTNAKTRRVSVCNALDCLIIHACALQHLPAICRDLAAKHVILYADVPALSTLTGHYPADLLKAATDNDFGHEYLDYKMSIRTVPSTNHALAHIATYGSKHSECIVTESDDTAARFLREVDAACVYVNVSTAFTDGAQFGFGAEIGISTQKLHARGPMALRELTTYKYQICGDGQVRS